MYRVNKGAVLGLILGLVIGCVLTYFFLKSQPQEALVSDPHVVNKLLEVTYQTSLVDIVSKTVENDSFVIGFILEGKQNTYELPVSEAEYRLIKIGDSQQVQYLPTLSGDNIQQVNWARDPLGNLTFNHQQPLVVIDAGHGGIETGEGGNDLFLEKDMNLQMSLYMAKLLEEAGIEVVLTRDSDDYVSLVTRAEMVNYVKPDLFISNHNNKLNKKTSGVEVHYSQLADENFANDLARAISDDTLKVQRVVNRRGDTPEMDYYFVHKYLDCPSYIIEYGFADHSIDGPYIYENWQMLVERVAVEIIRYMSED